ncbi:MULTISPECIES: hypothetical protein [unclassified Mesorhizobium]|uniref:hypothetical protein n=1 Tax=unclassified Mesorhizobium TaxID=325217 RepID=UPI0015E36BE5|nr:MULTISPECIES: hypothetical protein [unclassified Mesorhizobium]MBZ9919010.1 hypothetical protein [Mesorhizobium sp. BR1-1-7]MBZ9970587.1 hypothetical protein [Mesorhizobium sp. BR1-1-12]MCA0001078.1 hypothetical protein [Mesorhizobium sp. B264B2A]MCA0004827.1 hypothetical protein [Mesorhizobium sp. B264B1B]MCA0018383.1 hypothetical protein [Mesorhizobium sp. B264B1A]
MISESRQGWRRQWVKVKPRTLRKALARKSIRKRAMMSFGRKSPIPVRSKMKKPRKGLNAQECGGSVMNGRLPEGGDRHRQRPVLDPASFRG